MNIAKISVPMSLLVAAIGIAAGSGGSWAVTGAKVEALTLSDAKQDMAIRAVQAENQAQRERQVRSDAILEETYKAVRRIEQLMDGQR